MSTRESGFKNLRIKCRVHRIRCDGSLVRKKRSHRSVHLSVIVSRVCDVFFKSSTCVCRNVVNWQVLVEIGEKGDVDEFFLIILTASWLTEYRTRTITKKCYGLRATSPFRVASERVSQLQSRGIEQLSLPTPGSCLTPASPFTRHSRVTSLGKVAGRLLQFS